jgi:tRNA1(Val) A37 N6-methylase TrmN6
VEDFTDLPPDIIETTLLNGRVNLLQPTKGYRIGMDGALLAAAAACVLGDKSAHVLELGSGVGGVMLSLSLRCPRLEITGLEREALSYDLLCENLKRHDYSQRLKAILGDVGQGFKTLNLARFDLIMSNPPYFDDPETLRAPHELKRPAWIADDGLRAWLQFAQSSVKDGGDIVFIHRAERLGDIISGLDKCGTFVILPIQPFIDKEAKRVLVRAKRLGKAPLRLLPPLILHDGGDRKHTPYLEAILRGEAGLVW